MNMSLIARFQMLHVGYAYYLNKFVDFIDTFCFIARKKFSHVRWAWALFPLVGILKLASALEARRGYQKSTQMEGRLRDCDNEKGGQKIRKFFRHHLSLVPYNIILFGHGSPNTIAVFFTSSTMALRPYHAFLAPDGSSEAMPPSSQCSTPSFTWSCTHTTWLPPWGRNIR